MDSGLPTSHSAIVQAAGQPIGKWSRRTRFSSAHFRRSRLFWLGLMGMIGLVGLWVSATQGGSYTSYTTSHEIFSLECYEGEFRVSMIVCKGPVPIGSPAGWHLEKHPHGDGPAPLFRLLPMPGIHLGWDSGPAATGGGLSLAYWLAILVYSTIWTSLLYRRLRQRRKLLRETPEISAIA